MHITFDTPGFTPFALWCEQNPGLIQEAAQIGYVVLSGSVDKYYRQNIANVHNAEWEKKLEKRDTMHAIELASAKDYVSLVKSNIDSLVESRCSDRDGIIKQLTARVNEMKEDIDKKEAALAQALQNEQLNHMKRTIAEKEAEIRVLKSSNHVKGATGECMLIKYIQQHFSAWTIAHTGSRAAEADIHVKDLDNNLVIIESKLKDRITCQDVTKFSRDVDEMVARNGCIGGIFVSITCANIPSKGGLCVEMRNGVPVMYCGFKDETDMQAILSGLMKIFFQLCAHVKKIAHTTGTDPDTNAAELIDHLAACFSVIDKNMSQLRKMKDSYLAPMERCMKDMMDSNLKILQSIEPLVSATLVSETASSGDGGEKFKCSECACVYNRKADLTKHKKSKH